MTKDSLPTDDALARETRDRELAHLRQHPYIEELPVLDALTRIRGMTYAAANKMLQASRRVSPTLHRDTEVLDIVRRLNAAPHRGQWLVQLDGMPTRLLSDTQLLQAGKAIDQAGAVPRFLNDLEGPTYEHTVFVPLTIDQCEEREHERLGDVLAESSKVAGFRLEEGHHGCTLHVIGVTWSELDYLIEETLDAQMVPYTDEPHYEWGVDGEANND